MVALTGFLFLQNTTLSRTNEDLLEQLQNATRTNEELLMKLNQTTFEFENLKDNYTALTHVFDTDAKIETRLGIRLLEKNDTKITQYLWVTGEVENHEDRTLYDVRLMFTLTTVKGNETKYYVIGVMEPHQVMIVRHTIFASQSDQILGWSMITVSAPGR